MTQPIFVLDTNIVLYYLGGRLSSPLPQGIYAISIITEMELLAYPNLSQADEQKILGFLAQILVVNLDDAIKQGAIALRKQFRLKLPDAIIVATAQSRKATLLTNDQQILNSSVAQTQSLPMA